MKAKCKLCGDEFTITKEEIELHSEGECNLPSICDECFQMSEEQSYDEPLSDADMGL